MSMKRRIQRSIHRASGTPWPNTSPVEKLRRRRLADPKFRFKWVGRDQWVEVKR